MRIYRCFIAISELDSMERTWRSMIEPCHRSLHRLVHRLEERNADDTATADHQRLERDVVELERIFWLQRTSQERFDEADA